MHRFLALAVLLVMSLPATALAGTATVGEIVTDPKYGSTEPALYYTATPGEHNAIGVVRDGSAVVLRDDGAATRPGPGCTTVDARTVTCSAPTGAFGTPTLLIVIDAGDGDDTVIVPALAESRGGTSVSGGDGADTLTGAGRLYGGGGDDRLTGSPAGDILRGGSGDDVLRAGAGNDMLTGDGGDDERSSDDAGGGDDRIDGGAGRDRVLYSARRSGVRVDLATGKATAAGGEHDRLARIESVTGGQGADVLLGDARGNALDGFPGDDRIDGRGGNDSLAGGNGVDTLRGGSGNDSLFTHDRRDALFGGPGNDHLAASYNASRAARRFRCGSGRDTVDGDPLGGLLVDCERVVPIGGRLSARPRADGAVRLDWSCDAVFLTRCKLTATLRRGSRRLATANASSRDRATRSLLLRPRPRPPRGTIVEVVVAGDAVLEEERFHLRFAANWRIRL